MRRWKKVTLFLLAPILATLVISAFLSWKNAPPRKPESIPPGDYSYTVDYAESRMQRFMEQHHLPGVAVALIDDQDVIWQSAFGLADIEKEIPAQVDTVFKVWSLAKVFTAIETMRLVEEGLIDLDAPITDYLPGFTIQSRFPQTGAITVRHILAHRSGLPRSECLALSSWNTGPNALGALVRSLEDCHLAFPTGTRYKYSNIGFDMLGYLIQDMRGEKFPDYMRENLLIPLGMEDSAFLLADIPPQKDIASGYEYYKGEFYPLEQMEIANLPRGNMNSTLEDMSEFVRFVFRGGEAGGEQIIRSETLTAMFEDQFSSQSDPQPMGLGWKIARVIGSELLVWHDGGPSEGIGSLVALLPERKLGVVLFANGTSFDGSISVALALEVLELMLETKYGLAPPDEQVSAPVDIDRSLLDGYVGKYIAYGQVMEVSLRGDRLKGKIQGMSFDLVPVSQTRFRLDHWLLSLGLADLLQLPIDLRKLGVEFLVGSETQEDVLIINAGDVNYEICPRYPDLEDLPAFWEGLVGEYEIYARLPSGRVGREVLGKSEIQVVDGVLRMSGVIGTIRPLSETEIIILGGPFLGETMIYEPDTGYVYHQSHVYKPVGRMVTPRPVTPAAATETAVHTGITVPLGVSPTIDGRMSPGEWDGARQETFSDGSELFLMYAEGYLYLGLRANPADMIAGNIFLERGDEVLILHASAALGTAIYAPGAQDWEQTQGFMWRCRATSDSPAAQAEREAFLQEEGWLANNSRMGTANELEYQIAIPEERLRLAVTFLRASDIEERIFWPVNLDDDCTRPTPGGMPTQLSFTLDEWATIEITE